MGMNKKNTQNGLTLVEVLAVLVLSAVVMTLAISIILSGQRTTTKTITETAEVNDLRMGLRIIGKDVRSAAKINIENNLLRLEVAGSEVTYEVQDSTLLQNNVPLVYNVTDMMLGIQDRTLTIQVSSNTIKDLDATYYLREGVTLTYE